MKLSARSEYALRALIDLAGSYGHGPVGVKEIAARQDIPERFLEQQISTLSKAGLIVSQRGAQGGVALARSPAKITVYDITKALEGPLTAEKCVGVSAQDCAKSAHCAVQDLWGQVNLAVRDVLENVNLAELADKQVNYDQSRQPMYYI